MSIKGQVVSSQPHPSDDGTFLIVLRTDEPNDSLTMHNDVLLVGDDEVLYRIDPDEDITVDSFIAADPHTGGQRALIQVWPERNNE